MNRRTILTSGISAVALAAAGVGLAVGLPTGSSPATAETRPRKTAKVTRQDLSDSETKSGTLGYGATTAVSNRQQGTVTWIAAQGTSVQRGQQLYRVDDQPVVLLFGALPFYRPLSAGMTGNDVKQLTENLKALGYSGFTSSNIRKWQKSLGWAETGMIEPSRIVLSTGPARVSSVDGKLGDSGGPVLSFTGTRKQVVVTMDVNDTRLAKLQAKVKVTLPDSKVVDGTIIAVRNVVQAGQGGDSTTKLEATVDLGEQQVDFDTASVRVAFTASTREKVLTVPIAALLALREGGYGIEVIKEGGTTQVVAVKVGLFSGGRVEVSGDGLAENLTVGMPS